MSTMAGVFVLFLLLGLGFGLLLYVFVRREREGVQMDRSAAERTARRDSDDGEPETVEDR